MPGKEIKPQTASVIHIDAADKELVTWLQSGDESALSSLLHRYFTPLRNYVYLTVGSYDTAQDIVQDLFVKLWNNRHDLAISGSVRSYLFRAAFNRALNARRDANARGRVHDNSIMSGDEARSSYNTGEALAQAESFQRAFQAVVKDLRPPAKEIMMLRFIQGMSYPEIAEVLQIPQANVRMALGRSLERLMARLKKLT